MRTKCAYKYHGDVAKRQDSPSITDNSFDHPTIPWSLRQQEETLPSIQKPFYQPVCSKMMLKPISLVALIVSVVALQASAAALTTCQDPLAQPLNACVEPQGADIGESAKWGCGWGSGWGCGWPWWRRCHRGCWW